jgi:superfamily I DNA/RNA helicase
MQSRFHRLEGKKPDTIEWYTFQGWCYHQWPASIPWITPIGLNKQKEIVDQVWKTTLQHTSISANQLATEINWVKDQLPMTQQEYLSIDRRGRGFALSDDHRLQMWHAIQTYQSQLQTQGLIDWGDVPQTIWNFYQQGKQTLPLYDSILIDEAQFFAPIWMRIIQKALKPQVSHLFIVADPTQGFLGRKATWKSLGLQARGHTHLLQRSYRTTYEIMQFATLFYRLRLPNEKDEDILFPATQHMPNGAFPQVIPLSSPQDEISRVANEIAQFVQHGCPRKDILVLHANKIAAQKLIEAIDDRLGKNAAMDPGTTYPGNYVRVTTLNAGAGLESPIVFLVGLREIFEEEQSLRISDAEREELMRDNTRKIYMAATRAGQRLVLTYVGDLPNILSEISQIESPKTDTSNQ